MAQRSQSKIEQNLFTQFTLVKKLSELCVNLCDFAVKNQQQPPPTLSLLSDLLANGISVPQPS